MRISEINLIVISHENTNNEPRCFQNLDKKKNNPESLSITRSILKSNQFVQVMRPNNPESFIQFHSTILEIFCPWTNEYG